MNEVATTILKQLGGNRFIAMTGAKKFVYDKNMLQFSLPARFAHDGINLVVITLEATDTYDVMFYRRHGIKLFDICRANGVFVDNLRSTFTLHTGLDVSL